jgi:taurine--2-oxoglutarate transaminase
VPPKDYLPRIAEICKKRGVLLIADEVMTGWGRTGSWFAVDHYGVKPDILCTAKGITSAMAPLGVVATTRAIAEYFDDHFFAHGHTYEAHPLTLAPAVAAIDEYKRLGLIDRARTLGESVGARLRAIAEKHPSVGDVRGMGLFWAIDLCADKATRRPFNTYQDKANRKPLVVDQVVADMGGKGISVMGWVNHIVIAPPLVITEEELEEAYAALDAALAISDRAMAASAT